MAVSLFKLVMSATTTTTTTARPDISRYFYQLEAADRSTTNWTLTAPSSKFYDDAGDSMSASPFTTIVASNGYYLLIVNGVVQQSGLYTVNTNNIVLTQASSLPVSAPITLVVNNFAPISSSTTTVTT